MTVISVRVDEETKKLMEQANINWSEFIRVAVKKRLQEERTRNLARAVLINERIRKNNKGEALGEDIVRKFRDERYTKDSY